MPKIKVSEATPIQLDWMVAKCENEDVSLINGQLETRWTENGWKPSTRWDQGGPIIERERISIKAQQPDWTAYIAICDGMTDRVLRGPTPLIAAMRCFCQSKLGNEVEIPGEL